MFLLFVLEKTQWIFFWLVSSAVRKSKTVKSWERAVCGGKETRIMNTKRDETKIQTSSVWNMILVCYATYISAPNLSLHTRKADG